MIKFLKKNTSSPYEIFHSYYLEALKVKQESLDVIAVSSFNKNLEEVDSRYVNLKYINDEEWIFFSNYNSKKGQDFINHNQVSFLLYWNKIDFQLRMKGKIVKTSKKFSDEHFQSRSAKKNALAISSKQSKEIASYEEVINNYNQVLNNMSSLTQRPSYWGGYSFIPNHFEFWKGHESRINKREAFDKINGIWKHSFLQP